ncbi:YbaB/EbfC family nucleoid-associated protein [Streptomonospora sediminis]
MNPGGGMDMEALLQQAQQMQQQLMEAQQQLDEAKVEGTSGGGLVKVTVNGRGLVEEISIDPQAIDTEDTAETAQTVADMVLAAIRDAESSVEELQQEKMGPLAEGMGGGGMPGGGLPGGGGMPGLPGF